MDVVAVQRYAQAAFDASAKIGESAKMENDLRVLSGAFTSSGLKGFFANPRNKREAKERVIAGLEKSFESKLTGNLLRVLLRKGRISLIAQITDVFVDLGKKARGIVACEVTLAQAPSPDFQNKIKELLKRLTHSEVELSIKTDATAIGGVAVRIGNRILDATFKTKLFNLKQRMLKAKLQ